MENVKHLHNVKKKDFVVLYFKLCDKLGDFIRKTTRYSDVELEFYMNKNNVIRYEIARADDFEEIEDDVVNTIERIANEKDDAYFYNNVLSKNGHHISPSKMHELMRTKYGLADINEEYSEDGPNRNDHKIEWWVAHFFISLSRLIFDEPISFGDGEPEEIDDINEVSTADSPSISELLKQIKKIDKIVVVDDASKIGPEEIKKIREEIADK